MLRFLLAAALAAGALAAIKDPKSAKDCKANHDAVVLDITTSVADKCEALVAFSKCISAFPSDDAAESVLFEKNMKACESQWTATGAPEVRTRRGNLEMTVDDAKDVTFYRHRRETINVFTMHETLSRLVSTVTSTQEELAKTKELINNQVAADLKKLNDDTAKSLKANELSVKALGDKVSKDLSGAESARDDAIEKLQGQVTKDLSESKKARETAISQLSKKVDDANKKAKEDVDKAVGGVAEKLNDRPIFMWSGGSRSSHRGSGWRTFQMNRIEYDNAEPYFKRISDEKFKVLKDGLYRYDIDYMSHSNGRCWSHFRFYVNGQHVNGNNHMYVHSWRQMQYDITWYMKAGQEFWSRVYISNCGNPYFWHGGGSWKDAHNRLQVTYMGQFGKSGSHKCTSQYGIC